MINLGGQPKPYDNRDFQLGQYQAPVPLPSTYTTDVSTIKKLFQNGWPACGAHAGAHLKEVQEGVALSPEYLWRFIKLTDGFPPEIGTDIRSIMKTLQTWGVCEYDLLPNDYTLNLTQYTHPIITDAEVANAKPHSILSYAFDDYPTIQSVKQDIFQNKIAIFLIWCDDGFFGTDKPTFTQKKYGHFVLGYGWSLDSFLIVDSTEVAFPLKEIPFTAISFIREVGTAIDLPDHFIFKNNLYLGCTYINSALKEEVRQLQLRLGMAPADCIGVFGPKTLAAVIKYQLAHNISPALGYVGSLTRTSLNTS